MIMSVRIYVHFEAYLITQFDAQEVDWLKWLLVTFLRLLEDSELNLSNPTSFQIRNLIDIKPIT